MLLIPANSKNVIPDFGVSKLLPRIRKSLDQKFLQGEQKNEKNDSKTFVIVSYADRIGKFNYRKHKHTGNGK